MNIRKIVYILRTMSYHSLLYVIKSNRNGHLYPDGISASCEGRR